MHKFSHRKKSVLVFLPFFLIFCSLCSLLYVYPALSQEQISITTFYPAPRGRYEELRADRTSVGSNYCNAAVFPINTGNFIAIGPVGLGTATPAALFDIVDATNEQGTMLSISGYDNDTAGGGVLPYNIVTLVDQNGNSDFVIRAQAPLPNDADVRVGINTPIPSATLDVQGDTNVCVRRVYRRDTLVTPCPAGYYITVGPVAAADPGPPPAELSFLCCRFCDDNDLDGICD